MSITSNPALDSEAGWRLTEEGERALQEQEQASKSTPGPWIRWEKDEENYQLIEYEGNIEIGEDPPPGHSGFRIATVWRTPRDDAEANARLIIAAPALLEALEDLLRESGALDGDCDCRSCVKGRAAIAQARGVQP